MKTVAVLVPSFAVEYSLEFLAGIYDYFNEKDVRVLVSHSRYYNDSTGAFNYQYWSVMNLLKSEEVDVVICASGMYQSTMTRAELEKELKSFVNKPVVSVSLDFDFEKCHSITQKINCDEIFNEIVSHLKTKHGCKEFAFLAANTLNSEEGDERYNAFLNAIKKYDLSFSTENLIEGKFVYEIAKDELKKKYKSKKDVKFDAVVAANDAMAIAAMDYFDELGIHVPNEVKIVGFDDSISSRLVHPRLSTISQNVYGQGYRAAEIANDILDGKSVEKNEITELRAIYRQSCGCVDKRNPDPICFDSYGNQSFENDVVTVKENYADVIRDKVGIIVFMDIVKSSNTLRQLFYDLAYIVHTAKFENMQISFYKEPVFLDSKEEFVVPECAEFKMYFDSERNVGEILDNVYFNPRKTLFSEKYLPNSKGMHIIQPIFSGEVNYGYIISKISSKEFVDYGVYLKILINALSQSYDYTYQLLENEKLKIENTDLNEVSRTDELTKILNRRGFKEKGQRAIDLAQETFQPVVVFFGDMDGLKKINDTYGHEMGDKAIKLQAEVLKKAFRADDIVGRLSGDEFGIIAVGMQLDRIDSVREQIANLSEKISKKNKLPFTLSISLGAVDLQSSSNLKRLLSEADKKLYIEKQIKHAKDK